jgi:hypothetical protein
MALCDSVVYPQIASAFGYLISSLLNLGGFSVELGNANSTIQTLTVVQRYIFKRESRMPILSTRRRKAFDEFSLSAFTRLT